MIDFLTATLICLGTAPTTPKTNVEIEIRPDKFSTIRFEIAEGSLAGTAYIQSIGRMEGFQTESIVKYLSDSGGRKPAHLTLRVSGNQIERAYFYHYGAGMNRAPVECEIQDPTADLKLDPL